MAKFRIQLNAVFDAQDLAQARRLVAGFCAGQLLGEPVDCPLGDPVGFYELKEDELSTLTNKSREELLRLFAEREVSP